MPEIKGPYQYANERDFLREFPREVDKVIDARAREWGLSAKERLDLWADVNQALIRNLETMVDAKLESVDIDEMIRIEVDAWVGKRSSCVN